MFLALPFLASFIGLLQIWRIIMQEEKKQIHIQVKDKIATFVSMNFTLGGVPLPSPRWKVRQCD